MDVPLIRRCITTPDYMSETLFGKVILRALRCVKWLLDTFICAVVFSTKRTTSVQGDMTEGGGVGGWEGEGGSLAFFPPPFPSLV